MSNLPLDEEGRRALSEKLHAATARHGQLRLDRGAEEIKRLTTGLDGRIVALESWLKNLPGRVETHVTIPDPTEPETRAFQLLLQRSTWKLVCRYVGKLPNNVGWAELSAWKPVTESRLDEKIAAMDAIEALFAKMEAAQSSLVARLREANKKYDLIAVQLGIPKPVVQVRHHGEPAVDETGTTAKEGA